MRCEVCGRSIVGKSYKVIIEGAKMLACGRCARLGSGYWKAPPPPQRSAKRVIRLPNPSIRRRPTVPAQTLELVGDFSLRVRRARENLGLTHEDLGKKIGEKVSVLRKIESGRMSPSHKLANKLEHTLKTELLVPLSEPKLPPVDLSLPREATLGEVVRLKGKKTEVHEEREPS